MPQRNASEPEAQNELERLIKAAAEGPALQGEMFRKLWEAELCAVATLGLGGYSPP